MVQPKDPVVIVGGGPIGLACALLFAQREIRCCVLEARSLEQARNDPRLLALSNGTWQVLEPLLHAQTLRRAPIREVFVSSAGEFGGAHLSSRDFGGAELGATARYGDLLAALDAAAREDGRIELLRPQRVGRLSQSPAAVTVELDSGTQRTAPLVILAEGSGPATGEAFDDGTALQVQHAESFALLANVRLQRPSDGLAASAFERFTREGPLALLPTPDQGASGAETFALVWCSDQANAKRRTGIDDHAFIAELNSVIGPRIGRVLAVTTRHAAALPQRLRRQLVAHRVVALGNAAQTLHPVAGQGFNLGLRDCVTLAQCLTQDDDMLRALRTYAQHRRVDREAIATLTRWLPSLFATRFLPIALARSAALAALGITPAARRDLAHLLMFGVRM